METTELKRRCAFHESGHVLAAVRLGIPIKFVTIADRPHLRRATYRDHHVSSASSGWRCCVWPVQKPKRCFAASLAMAATQQTTEWRANT
jgi:hypothetical protein